MNKWVPFSIIFFFIGVVGLVALSVTYFYTSTEDFSYGLIFDAGSSHTTLYIYRWPHTKINNTGVVEQLTSCSVAGSGISGYVATPDKAGASLLSCLETAKSYVPASQFSATPAYLGATAGMRILSQTNPNGSDLVLASVRSAIGSSGFKVTDAAEQVRIITGQEEGVGAWVTINYVLGSLGNFLSGTLMHLTSSPTGSLDLGGASTQITFVDGNPALTPRNYSKEVVLFLNDYHLYSYSFLCYGLNEAVLRHYAQLVAEQPTSTTIFDPCLPLGFSTNKSVTSLFSSFCTASLKPAVTHSIYTFQGLSNESECALKVKSLFDLKSCTYWNCSFNGAFMPSVSGADFTAFSGYYYVTGDLGLTGVFSRQQYVDEMSSTCAKSWSQLQLNATSPEKVCVSAHYVYTLLTDGYKFGEAAWQSLLFANSANGTDFGWALGYMLNQTNTIASSTPLRMLSVSEAVYSVIMVLFGLIVLLAVAFTFMACRKGQNYEAY